MQQTTIEMFLEFLQEQNHTKSTVNSYVRLIRDLEEPPETDNPKDLLSFIDDALFEKEKPVLEVFWSWLEQQKPVRNTRMDKAVNYVLNRRETAETYLEDGRCSFTNNLSENAIRPFAVGRKNWLFSDSVSGANATCVLICMGGLLLLPMC